MIDLARELVGGSFGGMRVAVLGAGVQAQQRRHPRQPGARRRASIQRQGAAVCLYDPQAMDNARVKHPELGYRESALEAAKGADIVLHLTEWAEFRSMDPAVLGEVVADRRIDRRPQRPRPGSLARRRLDLPRLGRP
jgi:UDPglucose 6-dehydrogenase